VSEQRRQEPAGPPLLTALSTFPQRPPLMVSLAPPSERRLDGGLCDLPGVRQQVAAIERAFGGKVVRLEEDQATVDAVRQAAPEARLLHFATHAFPNDTAPLMGALVLAPRNPEDAGLFYARDVYDLRLKADLAVLSACSTMEGPATGEGIVGLAWAFLVAGCPSVVAARWPLEDEAARVWVEEFYRHYATGKRTKGECFQLACKKLIGTKDREPDFSLPWYWAGWTLLGDDR
jgi:CHAT domain-containing protein